jgi:DNA-binding transcriptional LysR family regulator
LVSSVLAPLVAPLLERHPGVELELITDTRHLNLLRREADLALRPSRFEQAEIVQRQVALLRFGLYASDAYLARHGPPDFARQCAGHGLIAMSESLGKVPEVAWLPSFASHARVVARCNGREPMLTLALAGLGLVCLPRFLGDRAGLRLLPTPEPAPERALYLGMHRDARKQARVRACADFLAERLAQLGPLLAA